MFGYVRARQDTLSEGGRAAYEAAYCGLCRRLGRRRGQFARSFLNYDFAFLAMLLAPGEYELEGKCRPCVMHPLKGKPTCEGGDFLDVAADTGVILTYWKLRDVAADEGGAAALAARGMALGLRSAYEGARKAQPNFDRAVIDCLQELRKLEGEGCPSIDRTADCFARLLQAAAPTTGESARDRATAQLLYHLGRWIYLIDGVDDLAEDRQAGRYNPVAARFPAWSEEDKTYLRRVMDHSLELAGAAFQLMERNVWADVIENILYSGLPGVEELVFSGQWREYKKKYRRSKHE